MCISTWQQAQYFQQQSKSKPSNSIRNIMRGINHRKPAGGQSDKQRNNQLV